MVRLKQYDGHEMEADMMRIGDEMSMKIPVSIREATLRGWRTRHVGAESWMKNVRGRKKLFVEAPQCGSRRN